MKRSLISEPLQNFNLCKIFIRNGWNLNSPLKGSYWEVAWKVLKDRMQRFDSDIIPQNNRFVNEEFEKFFTLGKLLYDCGAKADEHSDKYIGLLIEILGNIPSQFQNEDHIQILDDLINLRNSKYVPTLKFFAILAIRKQIGFHFPWKLESESINTLLPSKVKAQLVFEDVFDHPSNTLWNNLIQTIKTGNFLEKKPFFDSMKLVLGQEPEKYLSKFQIRSVDYSVIEFLCLHAPLEMDYHTIDNLVKAVFKTISDRDSVVDILRSSLNCAILMHRKEVTISLIKMLQRINGNGCEEGGSPFRFLNKTHFSDICSFSSYRFVNHNMQLLIDVTEKYPRLKKEMISEKLHPVIVACLAGNFEFLFENTMIIDSSNLNLVFKLCFLLKDLVK